MNHDQRIALLQAACTMATAARPTTMAAVAEHGGTRGRVLFYYAWLQKIVQSPYDTPNEAERTRLLEMTQVEDLDKCP